MKGFDENKALRKLRFRQNKNKYIKYGTIGISCLILVIGIMLFFFFFFQINEEFTLINGKLTDLGDYKIAYYKDNQYQNSKPTSDSGVEFDKYTCNKEGVTLTWDEGEWGPIINSNVSNAKCNVYFKTKTNTWQLPGGVDLYTGMKPIVFEGSTIKVADTTTEWYNYDKHNWANAALVTSSARSKSAGETLSESEILQMYVWIPRYAYKKWEKTNYNSNEQIIKVILEPSSKKDTNGYVTHPAFTFGTTELNGIWVGKFETSATSGIQTTENQLCTAEGCANAANIRILPNKISATNNNIFNMYNASRSIESNSTFGLTASQVDTHMMKNTEWGAVAYFTQSRYGLYKSDGTCNNASQATSNGCEVFINNVNVGYGNDSTHDVSLQWGGTVTGCSGDSVNAGISNTHNQTNPTCASGRTWDSLGVLSSTTGNITGVYDMSGGAWEYVMGNMANSTTIYTYNAKSSGMTTQPQDKYLDKYLATATDTTTMSDDNQSKVQNRGILGDATTEVMKTYGSLTGAWNSDYSYFVSSSNPWFERGVHAIDGATAGIFAFGRYHGGAGTGGSFRVVLSAQ